MHQVPLKKRTGKKVFLSVVALLVVLSVIPAIAITISHVESAHAKSAVPPLAFVQYGKHRVALAQHSAPPPTDTQCRTAAGFPCYSPKKFVMLTM